MRASGPLTAVDVAAIARFQRFLTLVAAGPEGVLVALESGDYQLIAGGWLRAVRGLPPDGQGDAQ